MNRGFFMIYIYSAVQLHFLFKALNRIRTSFKCQLCIFKHGSGFL
jgi:hypothetical protein